MARLFDLDAARLGDALVRAVARSALLGHKHVADTLRDYCGDTTTPEGEFIRDVCTKPTPEIAEKWFGASWKPRRRSPTG